MLKVAELDEIERQYIKHHDLEKQLRGERKIRKWFKNTQGKAKRRELRLYPVFTVSFH